MSPIWIFLFLMVPICDPHCFISWVWIAQTTWNVNFLLLFWATFICGPKSILFFCNVLQYDPCLNDHIWSHVTYVIRSHWHLTLATFKNDNVHSHIKIRPDQQIRIEHQFLQCDCNLRICNTAETDGFIHTTSVCPILKPFWSWTLNLVDLSILH